MVEKYKTLEDGTPYFPVDMEKLKERMRLKDSIKKSLEVKDKVVRENNGNFIELVREVFNDVNRRYGGRFGLAFDRDWLAGEEMCDYDVMARFCYRHDDGNKEELGSVYARSDSWCREKGLKLESFGEPSEEAEDITSRFISDLKKYLDIKKMPDARDNVGANYSFQESNPTQTDYNKVLKDSKRELETWKKPKPKYDPGGVRIEIVHVKSASAA
ncbi:hypothetical protein KY345_02045 [Candidatus Woesearchaeota archaeon]|nr:hypothetical protein [Candidatus Woesearchaeota archaeon]